MDIFELRKGLYARLSAICTPDVYSFVPQNASFPYVEIEEIQAENADAKGGLDMQVYNLFLSIYANSPSSEAVEDYIAETLNALQRQEANISASGLTVVQSRFVRSRVLRLGGGQDGGEKVWRGIVEFELIVQDT